MSLATLPVLCPQAFCDNNLPDYLRPSDVLALAVHFVIGSFDNATGRINS